MSREVKFRGKRIDNGEWVYGYYTMIKFPESLNGVKNMGTWQKPNYQLTEEYVHLQKCLGINEGCYWFAAIQQSDNFHSIVQVYSETVGQFAGLLDKNGVDIYEGDIVRAHSMAIEDNPSNNVVKFENGSFRYNCEPKADVPCGCYKSSEVEVIGNIHDNPELMEVRP